VIFKKKKKNVVACTYGKPKMIFRLWIGLRSRLNPIENVWSIVKRKLQAKRVFSLKQRCVELSGATTCGKSYRKYVKTVPMNSQ